MITRKRKVKLDNNNNISSSINNDVNKKKNCYKNNEGNSCSRSKKKLNQNENRNSITSDVNYNKCYNDKNYCTDENIFYDERYSCDDDAELSCLNDDDYIYGKTSDASSSYYKKRKKKKKKGKNNNNNNKTEINKKVKKEKENEKEGNDENFSKKKNEEKKPRKKRFEKKNTIVERMHNFIYQKNEYFDLDLFKYLSILTEIDEQKMNEHFSYFVISEFLNVMRFSKRGRENINQDVIKQKNINDNIYIDDHIDCQNIKEKVIYINENSEMKKEEESDISRMNVSNYISNKIFNIKENIDLKCILNHDNTNWRNIFFLEDIQIHLNNKKFKVSPFSSESVVDNIKKSYLLKKKKKKNICHIKQKVKDENHDFYNYLEKIKIYINRQKKNRQEERRKEYEENNSFDMETNVDMIDENNILHPDMIVFLYFLLICNSLCNEIKENSIEEENKSQGKNINEEETLKNIENLLDNLEEYLSKDLSSENIFLSLCCPINYMDFSDSINMVTYLSFFLNEKNGMNKNIYNKDTYHINLCYNNKNNNIFEDEVLYNDKNTIENNNYTRSIIKNDVKNSIYQNNDNIYNKKKENYIYNLINDMMIKCSEIFEGNILSISIYSYLNSDAYYNSDKPGRNFIVFYFLSKYLCKPILIDIIEHTYMCKKMEWIKFDSLNEGKRKEYIYLLLCLLGNKIKIFAISKYYFFVNIYMSLKNQRKKDSYNNIYSFIKKEKRMEKKNKKKKQKIKKIFTYTSSEYINDFSYTICIKDHKRYLKIALCFNNFKIKIIDIILNIVNKEENKINTFIENSKTINISLQYGEEYEKFLFFNKNETKINKNMQSFEGNIKENEELIDNYSWNKEMKKKENFLLTNCSSDNENKDDKNDDVINYDDVDCSDHHNIDCVNDRNNNLYISDKGNTHLETHNDIPFSIKKKKINLSNNIYVSNINKINIREEIICLQHGVLSLCSFYPCINSYLLCLCSKDGNIVIIDIRNSKELFYFKRKTETCSHLKWYRNSCISFGQDKGSIINLFENKYILNIDKSFFNTVDNSCLNSVLIGDHMYLFLYDDNTILKGQTKENSSKNKYNEFFLWKTKCVDLDPSILLEISCMQTEDIYSVSMILLYEYLRGLQNVLNDGIKIVRSKKWDQECTGKNRALTPKSISYASFDKNYIIAYGTSCGLIHIFSQEKDENNNV
ncbi:conserved Plasmodium protein, unknown function [Plasmodium sp. gorilla clade G3]|nr:conserved Plasmodium protein, unknown function [Plasmodium sp. gorilla clade G3]